MPAEAGEFTGAYWHLGEERDAGADGYSLGLCRDVLARVRTDLDHFTAAEFEVLVNHGYFSCEAGLVPTASATAEASAAAWPVSRWSRGSARAPGAAPQPSRFLQARWWQN